MVGHAYDVNFDEIKLLFYKHTSPDFAEYCLKSVTNKKDYTLEVKISGKLPNEDLRRRFLQRKGVQKYLDCIAQNKSVAGNFEGLFKEIQPDLDELFARFGIKYIIPEKSYTEVCAACFSLELKFSPSDELNRYVPLFFLEFSLYSPEFIKLSKIEAIYFIGYLNYVTPSYQQYRAACPEYFKTMSMYYCTCETSIKYITYVIHHEFFHFVDEIDDNS